VDAPVVGEADNVGSELLVAFEILHGDCC
jgi:hypothetical protein